MNIRPIRFLIILFVILPGTPAMLLGQPAAAQERPTLVYAVGDADAGDTDPHYGVTWFSRAAMNMMFNGLLRYAPGELEVFEPDIATEMPTPTLNDDGTQTWTFTLRDDVLCHPGPETEAYQLTADDVVFSFNKASSHETSNFAPDYEGFSFTKVDDLTVEVTVDTPLSEALFHPRMAAYAGGYIVCQQAYEAQGSEGFRNHPVGTGPFMFSEYSPQFVYNLIAWDDYFRGTPQLAGVDIRFIPDATTRELALSSGEVDVIFGQSESRWAQRIDEMDGFTADVFGAGDVVLLNINVQQEPFDDPLVREAVFLAISTEGHRALSGELVGEPVYSVIPDQFMAGGLSQDEAEAAGTIYEQDTERARELLAEAGYPDGFEIDLVTTEVLIYRQNYEVLAEELRQVGIEVNLEVVQHPAYHELIRADENALVIYVVYRPSADTYLQQFFANNGSATWFSKYDTSSHIEAALATTDSDEQHEAWQTANIDIAQNFAGYGLYAVLQVFARSDAVDYGHDLNATIHNYPVFDENTRIKANGG